MDNNGQTPLYSATSNNNINSARTLLRTGANIHHRDKEGNTLLHFLAYCYLDSFDDYSPYRPQPSHQMFAFLLDEGVDLHLKNNEGLTAWDIIQVRLRKDKKEDRELAHLFKEEISS